MLNLKTHKNLLIIFCLSFGLVTLSACRLEAPKTSGQSNNNNTTKPGDTPTCGDCGGGESLRATNELVQDITVKAWEDFPVFAGQFLSFAYQRSHSRHGVDDTLPEQLFLNDIDQAYNNEFNSLTSDLILKVERQLKRSLAFGELTLLASEIENVDKQEVILSRIKQSEASEYTEETLAMIRQSSKEASLRYMNIYWEARVRILVSRTTLKTESQCPSKIQGHKQAWVLSHSIGSDICYSPTELSKISPNSLKEEILSLLFHEFTHLLGKDENTSQDWQKKFRSFLTASEGMQNAEQIFRDFNQINLHINSTSQQLLTLLKSNPEDINEALRSSFFCKNYESHLGPKMSGFLETFPTIYVNAIRYRKSDEAYYKQRCQPAAYIKAFLGLLELTSKSKVSDLAMLCINPRYSFLQEHLNEHQLEWNIKTTSENLDIYHHNICDLENK